MSGTFTLGAPAIVRGDLFIGGRWTGAAQGGAYATVDPADELEGAELVAGGRLYHPQDADSGWYYPPTTFGHARNDMDCAGGDLRAVVTVIPFDTDEEAVTVGNDTKFGLASGVHARDIKRGHSIAAAMRAGTCWINTYNQWDPGISFGGCKESGYGREFGPEVMHYYTEMKSV